MKRTLLFFVTTLLATSSFAQTPDRYTISGGVLGTANYSRFRLSEEIPGTDSKFKWGYAPGVFLTIPLGGVVSLETQGQYSLVGTKYEAGNTTTYDQEL